MALTTSPAEGHETDRRPEPLVRAEDVCFGGENKEGVAEPVLRRKMGRLLDGDAHLND
ncbi:MAG: hypothetical protein PHI23_02885 [Candidatus Peribacteraceae bacterium]|nr:hypothetical protein [Candidatus Peribacteraceae bacterium]